MQESNLPLLESPASSWPFAPIAYLHWGLGDLKYKALLSVYPESIVGGFVRIGDEGEVI